MGYEDDGTPAAERTQTPDQVAATGLPGGGGSPRSLIDALGSMQGSVPNEAILSLLQGPSFGQRMAQAGAGGIAFARGVPNPVNAIIEQQQSQQMGIAKVLQQMQVDQRIRQQQMITNDLNQKKFILDEQNKKDELQLRTRAENRQNDQIIIDALKNNPSPIAQATYGAHMSKVSGANGVPIPAAFFAQQLAVPEKEQDNVRGAIEAGLDDAKILALYPHAQKPGYLEAERLVMKNPVMRAKLGYKTDEELRSIQFDFVTKKASAWATENGFKLDSHEFRYANAAFRQATGGRNIYDADPKSAPDLMAITQARKAGEQQALAKEQAEAEMKAAIQRETMDLANRAAEARQAARDDRREARQDAKPLSGTWVDMKNGLLLTPSEGEFRLNGGSKRYRNASAQEENLLSRLSVTASMHRQVTKLIDGLLVDNTPDNLVNALKGNVAKKVGNSPGWAQLKTLLTDQNIELTGALGPGQFRTQLMTYLQDAGVQTRNTREVAHIIQDSIETGIYNRRMSIISGANDAAQKDYKNPLTPTGLIPGARMNNGNIETLDGKFIFLNGKWQNKPAP